MPKSLQGKTGEESGGYYLIYRFLAFMTSAFHMTFAEVLNLDINEAGMLIKQYNYLHRDTTKKSKRPANSMPPVVPSKKAQD